MNDKDPWIIFIHYIASVVCGVAAVSCLLKEEWYTFAIYGGAAISLWAVATVVKLLSRIADAVEAKQGVENSAADSAKQTDGKVYTLD